MINLRKVNIFKVTSKIKNEKIRNAVLDKALTYAIPFNMGFGMKIRSLSEELSIIEMPPRHRRKNHLGTAHAISQCLLGEYCAGILITQKFDFSIYRFVLKKLDIEYHKPGVGSIIGKCQAPKVWPELKDGEVFIEMFTEIRNEKGELVSEVKTLWQVKDWNRTKKK